MAQILNVLLVEDSPLDAELLLVMLRRAGFDPRWKRVENEADFLANLHDGLDLVLSDYQMPQFTGLRALDLLVASGRQIPFILVSGTIGEETAVLAIKHGAADYLLKDRLTRLGTAVTQALEQNRLRRERRAAEEALHRADAHLNQLVARSPTIIYSLEMTGEKATVNYVSPNVAQLTGFTSEEMLAANWWHDQIHSEDREAAQSSLRAAMENGFSRTEYRIQGKDGRQIWLEDRKRLLTGPEGGVREIVGGWTDITVRKEAEDARRRAEARFHSIFEHAVDGIYQSTPEGKYLTANPALARMFGYESPEDLIRRVTDISAQLYVKPARRVDFQRELNDKGVVIGFEAQMYRQDGRVIWTTTNARAVRDDRGELLYEGIIEDITERKHLEEKLLRMQRVEAIGALASGLAHDLNNILVPMLMAAGMLKDKLTDQTDRDILGLAEQSVRRGAKIIAQLLTFGRGGEGERIGVRPENLIEEILRIMQETFPRDIEIVREIPNDLWGVVTDPTQMHQVLMNLCVNARDAMPEGGRLTLAARNVELDEAGAGGFAEASPGRYVELSVADTGQGIPPELLSRIFDPFFTTKGIGKGTGLGLSTVSSIVKNHGGFLTVESRMGEGTVFAIRIPASLVPVEVVEDAPENPVPVGKGELILVVDDEANIQQLLRQNLENNHYHVLTAANGEEALRTFVQHQARVRLVLTDVLMPGMGGLALIRALRMLEPRLKIIACSGQDQRSRTAELAAFGVMEVLAKPFSSAYLLKMLHRALTEKPAAEAPGELAAASVAELPGRGKL